MILQINKKDIEFIVTKYIMDKYGDVVLTWNGENLEAELVLSNLTNTNKANETNSPKQEENSITQFFK